MSTAIGPEQHLDVEEPSRRVHMEFPSLLLVLLPCTVVAVAFIIGATLVACISPDLFLLLRRDAQAAGGGR